MNNPKIPQKSPYTIKVEKEKIYFWCSCGLSSKQPFCDSSHKKDGKFEPIKFVADIDKVNVHHFVMDHIRGLNFK